MEFFKRKTSIDFLKIRAYTAIFSLLLLVLSVSTLATKGINWGLDFTGGIIIEMHYKKNADLSGARDVLKKTGYEDAVVQSFGSAQDMIIRLSPRVNMKEQKVANDIFNLLKESEQKVDPENIIEIRRVDAVGAQVGKEMGEQGGLAILVALIAIMLYIALRFEFRFSVSSAIALAHDPILILGIFSWFQIEFDLTALAAILAVIGYSLNDTIIVFDRVKENFIKIRKKTPLEIVNLSINETLSRTIMTSGLTLLVVIALLVYGGPTLFGFSLALFIGIVIGTYSSIYVAGALAIAMGLQKSDLLPTKPKELDSMP
tara:strand:+ start:1626 stop:2573 length:948 start_codon:yes stop_codon:yes gene_type:complete